VHDARHTYASLIIPGGDRHHVEGLAEALEVAQTFEESSTAAAEAERA
jgi:hypothetical protein